VVERKPVSKYREFPEEEYKNRCNMARQLMKEDHIDALLLTQKEHVEYFSGFITGHWTTKGFPPGVLILAQNDIALIVPEFLRGTALGTSWLDEVVSHKETHSDPRGFSALVVETISSMGLLKSRIGVETGPEMYMPLSIPDWECIKKGITGEIVPAGSLLWRLRIVKSPLEIEKIERACLIASRAFCELRMKAHRAMTEREMSILLKTSMIDNGADDYAFINLRSGLERYPMADTLPQDRKLREGDMVIVDTGANCGGYLSDMCRVGIVGKPTSEQVDVYALAVEAQKAGIRAVKPGVRAGDIFKAVDSVLGNKKRECRQLDMCGHGIGLDIHEPPILSKDEDLILRPGMIITIEPWVYYEWDTGVFAVEDLVLVTETGNRVLSDVPKDEIWIID